MPSQSEKARQFQALHAAPDAFVIPNPWDRGTARLLAQAGFRALATTSAGFAFSLGRPDNAVGREEMMQHIRDLAGATDLPLSADLENGFGHSPDEAAATVLRAAAHGAVGGSIEDATGDPRDPIYPLALATARIRACVAAARSLPFPFTLTARAENFLHGRPALADTVTRLGAYAAAGAAVVYAPGLTMREQIQTVLTAVPVPLNVLAGSPALRLSVADLSRMGVRRISVGSALSRAALGAVQRAITEIQEAGTFSFGGEALAYADLNARLGAS